MVTPSINTLLTKVDSRYTLVVLAAKRAREILESKKEIQEDGKPMNKVTVALDEVAREKISYVRTKGGIK